MTPNRIFYLWYFVFLSISICVLLKVPHGEELYYIHTFQSKSLDYVFRGISFLGEYIGLVSLGFLLLYRQYKHLLITGVVYLMGHLLVQYLKHYTNIPRPLAYGPTALLTPIANYPVLLYGSFPSGHTFTAFFLARYISLYFNAKALGSSIWIIIAIAVGISRMYLLVHFNIDVLVGSLLGIIFGESAFFLCKKTV